MIALVCSRFNQEIVQKLEMAARDFLSDKNVEVKTFWVPGAFEIPLMLKKLAYSKKYQGLVALGCIIRGETFHFELIANECTRGIMQVQLETGLPIGHGVLATENEEQSWARAGGQENNKGVEAASAMWEMMQLI